jgi:hypothetical protein
MSYQSHSAHSPHSIIYLSQQTMKGWYDGYGVYQF